MKKQIFILLILLTIVAFVNPVSAAVYSINGTVNRTDNNTRIVGATVFNGTNTTTTDADGAWGLSAMENNTGSTGWEITYRAPGFTQQVNYTNVSGANNITNNVSLTPLTPTQASVASSSVTKTSGVVSWTVTATDNINNNYVANRVRYSKDSALVNNLFYTSFSNSTTSPSFTLSGLELNAKYYYSADTYNIANGAYSASATGSFTTSKGNYTEDEEALYATSAPAPTPVIVQTPKKGIGLGSITGGKSGSTNKKFGAFVVAVLVVVVLFAWYTNSQSTSKGQKTSKVKKSKRKS